MARPVWSVPVASPPAAAADARSFSMNPNLMFAPGHAVSARRRSATPRACSAIISLSLLSPVRKDMRTKKLTMISSIAGVGLKSSSSGGGFTAGAALPLSDFCVFSSRSMSSASPIATSLSLSAPAGRIDSLSFPRAFAFAFASSSSGASSSSSSSSLSAAFLPPRVLAFPSLPLVRFFSGCAASRRSPAESRRPRFAPTRSGCSFSSSSSSGASSSSSSSSPSLGSLSSSSAAAFLSAASASAAANPGVLQSRTSSMRLTLSARFSSGDELGRPRRLWELTICGTNCARLG